MRIVGANLAEFLEDGRLVLRGDPNAGVSYRNLHGTVSLPGVNSNAPSLRSKLHRVGKEVEEYLLDLALIAHEIAKALEQTGVKAPVVSNPLCLSPVVSKGLGGDVPKWYYGIASSLTAARERF